MKSQRKTKQPPRSRSSSKKPVSTPWYKRTYIWVLIVIVLIAVAVFASFTIPAWLDKHNAYAMRDEVTKLKDKFVAAGSGAWKDESACLKIKARQIFENDRYTCEGKYTQTIGITSQRQIEDV
jgi:hypothetical protein